MRQTNTRLVIQVIGPSPIRRTVSIAIRKSVNFLDIDNLIFLRIDTSGLFSGPNSSIISTFRFRLLDLMSYPADRISPSDFRFAESSI